MKKLLIGILVSTAILFGAGRCPAQDKAVPEGKLYFSFISSAYFMEKKWGHGMPLEGIKTTAEIAHSNGIPVTWLVNAKSAEAGAQLFTEYHEKYGDEVGLMITANQEEAEKWGGESDYMRRFMTKDKMKKWIESDLASIKQSLPWSNITIAGSGYRSTKMVEILQEVGMKAIWGHCWEQTYTDGISDRGAPWGFYYVNPKAYKVPNPEPGGLVAIEWTARDLNNAFRTGKPEVYSTDPNDVDRNNLVKHRNIDYWKGLVNQYRRNAKFDAVVPMMVHQEAHEMECDEAVCGYKGDDLKSTAEMLDELFKYVKETGAEIVTASKAVEAYRAANQSTPPTYALFKDVAPGSNNKELLIYFDKNGQLFFDEGKTSPIFIRNYIGITEKDMDSSEFAKVDDIPQASVTENVNDTMITMTIKAISNDEIAYGLAFWGDYTGCRIADTDKPGAKILEDRLVFFPVVLQPGENEITVNIDCKDAPWNQ